MWRAPHPQTLHCVFLWLQQQHSAAWSVKWSCLHRRGGACALNVSPSSARRKGRYSTPSNPARRTFASACLCVQRSRSLHSAAAHTFRSRPSQQQLPAVAIKQSHGQNPGLVSKNLSSKAFRKTNQQTPAPDIKRSGANFRGISADVNARSHGNLANTWRSPA